MWDMDNREMAGMQIHFGQKTVIIQYAIRYITEAHVLFHGKTIFASDSTDQGLSISDNELL